MPFKSFAQEAYLKHKHPEIYKQWVSKYGNYEGKKLYVKKKAKKK